LKELMDAQKETVGFNTGAAAGGKKDGPRGSLVDPRDTRPTLASQGIKKNLAQQARSLGALSDAAFEAKVPDARASVTNTFRRVVNAVEIEQERESYTGRIYQGGTVADLEALAASGQTFATIYGDPAWPFKTYSGKGKQRSAERHYDCMSLDAIA